MLVQKFIKPVKVMGAGMLTLLTLEILLRLFDPIGINYLYDEREMAHHAVYSDNGLYYYQPGVYSLKNFTLTVLDDYTRYLPDTPLSADCTAVAIGDSVTQGWSVNDNEQWLNLIAQRYPDVRFINAGMAGFNSRHIMIAQSHWLGQADFFIYYVNTNDILDTYSGTPPISMYAYLDAYLSYFITRLNPPAPKTFTHFWFDLDTIMRHENTIVFVDKSTLATALAARYPDRIITIDKYTSLKSLVDPHPDEKGMQQIASAITKDIGIMIERYCNGQRTADQTG